MNRFLLLIALFFSLTIFAQHTQKRIKIKFITQAPRIDGDLSDTAWKDAAIATDFVMLSPGLGSAAPENQKTKVKVLYDHKAIYIGAYLFDDNPASIPMQFATRDNDAIADYFEILINPFNDKQNDTSFFVSSTGTQADAKTTRGHEDFSWSAVWESAVLLHDDGWSVEIRIPYSALRFSGAVEQEWGINFLRMIKSKREEYVWNFIDKTKGSESEFPGLLTGIKAVNSPTRLSFHPFLQGMATHYKGETDWKGTAGLDLKYGINDSFTVDATLIPDFGQTAFDDVVLNLGPFEVQHEEKRAFFTEGTALFNKGHLLYTRRIGDTPLLYDNVTPDLLAGEIVVSNPEKTKMLNAIKISGRTSDGLGIGFFNALTNTTYAKIRNTTTNSEWLYLTNPLTNYNVFVLDKTLPRGSSVSFINTNVMRGESFTDANVSSLLLNYKMKNNRYVVDTDFSMSNHFLNNNIVSGYKTKVKLKEVMGSHRFSTSVSMADKQYDKNDLGYQEYNNFIRYRATYSYSTFEPIGIFNRIRIKNWINLEYMLDPYTYTDNVIGSYMRFTTQKQLSYGGHFEASLGNYYDYHEPRVFGRYYKRRGSQFTNIWISTDYRKKFAFDSGIETGFQLVEVQPYSFYGLTFSPRYRWSNRMQMIYSFVWKKAKNEKAYVSRNDDTTIFFGNRKSKELVNSMQATYHLSNKSAFALAFRHYWKQVAYSPQFYRLQTNGTLIDDPHQENYNRNFNMWNLDFSFNWEFAPGSQLVALYRNSLFDSDNQTQLQFVENINGIRTLPASNEVSLKLIYYIDFNKL